MLSDVTSVSHLSEVIAHATAPTFLLGAVAALISVLIGRMNGIIDRSRQLNAIRDDDAERTHLKADLPRLARRAKLMNDAIYLAAGSGIVTACLVILAFVLALLGARHEPGAALLFMVALGLFTASLVNLAREVRIGLTDLDHFG
jgi:hypothetical protein